MKYPKAKLSEIIDQALEDMLEKRDPERKIKRKEKRIGKTSLARNKEPQRWPMLEVREVPHNMPRSRYIPAHVKQKVWQRDKGMCGYVGMNGKKCSQRKAIEYDHIHPHALGGSSSVENIRLLCTTHNRFRSEQTFGYRP